MRTEQLIAALAADAGPRASAQVRIAGATAGAAVLSVAALLAVWGPRTDLAAALVSPAVSKSLLPLALAGIALWLAARLSRPEATGRAGWVATAALGLGVAAAFAVALAAGGVGGLAAEMARPSLRTCLVSVPLLSVPLLAGLLWAMRAAAPARPPMAGLALGLAAGGGAAAIYSLHCTEDAALFFLPAYAVAMAPAVLAGLVLGGRMLRW